MKNVMILTLVILCCYTENLFAQNTGVINRSATSVAGRTALDPNGDGYTSATTSGYGTSDVTNSEITLTSIPTYSVEPFGDLRRGPNHLYSDFVPDNNGNGVYLSYSNSNLIFRFRVGSIMPGSKGYSILIDIDNKFGATGPNADPNYQAATTGTNGNPGFEIEVVLETNSRIAIYNVDGTSSPTLIKSYTNWQDMSQVSVAGTFDNGDPDFFIDFYIPFSDLTASPFNLTTSSGLRFSATTVMSSQAAIGGPKSDVYGLADSGSSNDEYSTYINAQPPITIGTLGSGFGSVCTAAPTVNSPIGSGTVNISGTWTKSTLTGAAGSATITVYKNGVSVGTISNALSGTAWTLNNITLVNGDVITAKAQATGESMCQVSNSVTASACNSSTRPAMPILSCYSTSKGITGTNLSTGWTVHVDNITRNTQDDNSANSSGLFATPTGSSPNLSWTYSNGCSSGSPLTSGSYKVYYTNNTTGCVSEPAYVCAIGNGGSVLAGTLAPVITTPSNGVYTTATTFIAGTTDANTVLSLYINGTSVQTTTASAGGAFNFYNLNLIAGQSLYINAELNTGTVSSSKCAAQTTAAIIVCFTTPPIITSDNNNQITAGNPITGTSGEPSGTIIKVYTSTNTLVATTSVQANGTWSTGNAGTTPAIYNAVAGTSYYATAQNGSCGSSTNSANVSAATQTSASRCSNITGPVTAGSTSVSGTLTGSVASTIVNLYMDGINIGTTTTSNTSWTIAVSSTALYPNGTLTIGIQEPAKQEVVCSSSIVVGCSSSPAAPIINPASANVTQNQSVSYTISNAVAGYYYGIADGTTGKSFANGAWATSNGNLSLSTNPFNASGTYNVVVKATSLSGLTVCSSTPGTASVAVSGILPVHFLNVYASAEGNGINVNWTVSNELDVAFYEVERSLDCIHFETAGKLSYQPSNSTANHYLFFDPGQTAQKICYRIKQVDANGSSHYSTVVTVQTNQNILIQVSPNPATVTASLSIQSARETQAVLEIADLNGRRLRQQHVQLKKGMNTISVEGVNTLSKGTYLVKLITGETIYCQKLIKQ